MAESQSRYAIIEELTNKLNAERANIADCKAKISSGQIRHQIAYSNSLKDLERSKKNFEQTWVIKREDAKRLEEEYSRAKLALERELEKRTEDTENIKEESDLLLESEKNKLTEQILSSEAQIKELKEAIESLKQVSKESGKTTQITEEKPKK